jgi:hypothetical protein
MPAILSTRISGLERGRLLKNWRMGQSFMRPVGRENALLFDPGNLSGNLILIQEESFGGYGVLSIEGNGGGGEILEMK